MSLGASSRWPAVRAGTALRIDGWLALTAIAVAAAIGFRCVLPTNEDVSWLIELAGRTLAGARPYVDFFEVNPPAAIWLYLAPTALAHLLSIRPETATDAFVFIGYGASIALSHRILSGAGLLPRAVASPLLLASALVLLVLPSYTFAERDHIAVLAALPGLAAFAARRSGARLDRFDMLLAGLGDAVVVIIKPMFVLALLGPAAVLLVGMGWRAVAQAGELWIGAALAAVYGLGVLLIVPDFTLNMLPIAVAVYVPRRLPWPGLLLSIPRTLWPFGFLLLAACARTARVGPLAVMLAAASTGFEAAFLEQGKGFAYHLYPAASLGLLALAAGLLQARFGGTATTPGARGFPFALSAVFFGVCWVSALQDFAGRYDPAVLAPGLDAALRRLGPRPSVLTISGVLALGQPFVRAVGGEWAGSAPSTWISNDIAALEAQGVTNPAFAGYAAREQALYADDIARHRPDAVLVEGERWQAWIGASPALSRAMAAYRPSGPPYGTVTLWLRRDRTLRGPLA